MSFLMIIGKVIASILLLMLFFAGALKADPRSHNPEYGPLAEYTAGFILCVASVIGFYYLWLN